MGFTAKKISLLLQCNCQLILLMQGMGILIIFIELRQKGL